VFFPLSNDNLCSTSGDLFFFASASYSSGLLIRPPARFNALVSPAHAVEWSAQTKNHRPDTVLTSEAFFTSNPEIYMPFLEGTDKNGGIEARCQPFLLLSKGTNIFKT
jgi:hypothetical protein